MEFKALTIWKRMHSNGSPTDSVLVAAWHWPSSITWRWSITKQKVDSKRKLPLVSFVRTYKGRGFNFRLCFYSRLTGIWQIQTQPNMWKKRMAQAS